MRIVKPERTRGAATRSPVEGEHIGAGQDDGGTARERTYRIVLVGFGNIGRGVARVLRDQGENLARQYSMRVQIVAVSDPLRGNVYDPEGLPPGHRYFAPHDSDPNTTP